MKKIFLTLSLVVSLFLTSSCDEGLLDKYTPGTIEEEDAILSDADLQRLMNRTYTSLTPLSEIEFSSVFTDEVAIGFANGGQGLAQDYVFNLNSDADAPNDIWVTNYVVIAYANRVIKEADKLLATTFPGSLTVQRLKAEALTLRAYCHNQLLSYYSVDPKNMSALGVLLAIDVYPYTYTSLRKTNQEVYNQIDADLNDAIALFTTVGAPAVRENANIDFARATLARSYALRGDYPNALIQATAVINTSGLILANTANYRIMFHTDAQPANQEIIFKIKKTAGQTRTGAIWASINSTASGSPFFEVSHSFLNLFNPQYGPENPTTFVTPILTNADVRLTTNVATPTAVFRNGLYLTDPTYNKDTEVIPVRKYPGVTTASNRVLVNDIKISRLSEMYLIRAEAYAAANDLVNAAAQIQIVRNARRTAATPLIVLANTQAAWSEILKERRMEFAYEGYRYVDLKRLGVLAGAGIDRDPKDCTQFNACNAPALTDYRFTMPIPTAESNANNAILSQQNPGY